MFFGVKYLNLYKLHNLWYRAIQCYVILKLIELEITKNPSAANAQKNPLRFMCLT